MAIADDRAGGRAVISRPGAQPSWISPLSAAGPAGPRRTAPPGPERAALGGRAEARAERWRAGKRRASPPIGGEASARTSGDASGGARGDGSSGRRRPETDARRPGGARRRVATGRQRRVGPRRSSLKRRHGRSEKGTAVRAPSPGHLPVSLPGLGDTDALIARTPFRSGHVFLSASLPAASPLAMGSGRGAGTLTSSQARSLIVRGPATQAPGGDPAQRVSPAMAARRLVPPVRRT